MGRRTPPRATPTAATGRAGARAAPGWDTTTASAGATPRRRGTRPTTPGGAVRRIFRARAGTGCSTASDSAGNRNLMPLGRIGQQGAAATLLVVLGAIGFLALRARGSSRAATVPSCLTNPGATLGCYEQYYGSLVPPPRGADPFTHLKALEPGYPDPP